MNHEEKDRREKAFQALTEQQKSELEQEYKKLCQWNESERSKLEESLKKEGKWIESGLDANQQYYKDIIEEYKKRFRALQEKYGLV